MKKIGKILSVCVVLFMLAANPVFSFDLKLGDLQEGIKDFSEGIASSLPFYSTMGLNWSDAYIGQLFGLPPRFGVGASIGFVTMGSGMFNDLLGLFIDDFEMPNLNIGLPLPAYAFEARIGGIILPFDIGIKYGAFDTSKLGWEELLSGFGLDYMMFGVDFRYPLLDFKLMRFSVGLGYNLVKGGVSTKLGTGFSFDFENGSDKYLLSMSDLGLGIELQTNVLELKAQVSFPLFIVTPYAGMGVGIGWSKAGYYADSKFTFKKNGVDQNLEDLEKVLFDLFEIDTVTNEGFGYMANNTKMNMRFFGGISVNLFLFKLDVTLMYNFINFGATIGLRFQL